MFSEPSPPASGSPIVTEPVYHQLLRLCREEIRSGRYQPGDRFPSERELVAAHGVSRATANKVLSNLVAENLLVIRKGIGTFITGAKSLATSLREMESFTEHARAAGLAPETRVLEFRRLPASEAPESVRAGLDLPEDSAESLFFVERLRLAGEEPLILEHRWILAAQVPQLSKEDLGGSFYAYLRDRAHLPLTGEDHVISARTLDAGEASRLGSDPGAAALVVEGPGYTGESRPVWYQVLIYRGDRYRLRNEIRAEHRGTHTTVEFGPR